MFPMADFAQRVLCTCAGLDAFCRTVDDGNVLDQPRLKRQRRQQSHEEPFGIIDDDSFELPSREEMESDLAAEHCDERVDSDVLEYLTWGTHSGASHRMHS